MFKWLQRKATVSETWVEAAANEDGIELIGRSNRKTLRPVLGASILDHADRGGVEWMSSCRKGTCARCRCHVIEGAALLSEPNDAELLRLEQEELEGGYRLGCQSTIRTTGKIVVKHTPYF